MSVYNVHNIAVDGVSTITKNEVSMVCPLTDHKKTKVSEDTNLGDESL